LQSPKSAGIHRLFLSRSIIWCEMHSSIHSTGRDQSQFASTSTSYSSPIR
jgi:hypothetical protein